MPLLPKTLPAFFWHFIKQEWKWFIAIQFFCFGWSLDQTIFPYIVRVVIDHIAAYTGDKANMWHVLAPILTMGAAFWLYIEMTYRAAGVLMARTMPRVEAAIRMSMFQYVSRHSHSYFANNFAGSIANKISDMPPSASACLNLLMTLFIPAVVAFIIAVSFFAALHPSFALVIGIWICMHLGICIAFAKKCDKASHIHAEAKSTLSGKVVDSFSNTINVRLFARHHYEQQYLQHFQNDERQKHWQSLWTIEKMKFFLGALSFLGPGVATTWFTLHSWQQGSITIGEVVYILNTTWNVTMIAWIAGLQLPNLFKEFGVCNQALTVIQVRHDITDAPNAPALKVTNGEIVFDNVTFNYTPERNIFDGKNITIHAGEKVGLVGFSGSGKSTFVNLILRYFDVESGQIRIDGQNIASVTQDSLHENIAMIPQDTTLFHRSLLENIQYGKMDASYEEVMEASRKAHCDEFISQLHEGYDALVGERGVKLSGGQRQRIAIARAILKNAPILILDEATSALDSVTERLIQESLYHLMQGKTTIVIAHRLSTLSSMDRVLVFKDGKIIEDGNHNQLLTLQGHYAHLWQMQAGGFLPDEPEE